MIPELDLRTPEYIASRRLFGPPFLKLLSGILGFCMLVGAFYAATIYPDWLRRELEQEIGLAIGLREEVAPLLELAEETALLKARSDLEQDLIKSLDPPQEYLLVAKKLASAHRLNLEKVTVDRNGSLFLKGWSRDLGDIALFSQVLECEPCFVSSEVRLINRGPGGNYYFELTALGTGNGGEME